MIIQLSGCCIINKNDELLLLWKKKHQHFELPGGKVEKNESLEEAAIRECKEELGVNIIIKEYVEFNDFVIDNNTFRSHKFLGQIKKGQIPKVNEPDKFEKLFWLPIEKYKEFSCAPNVETYCEELQKNKNNSNE